MNGRQIEWIEFQDEPAFSAAIGKASGDPDSLWFRVRGFKDGVQFNVEWAFDGRRVADHLARWFPPIQDQPAPRSGT